jgi:fumarate reductase flavoprotein subunit
MKRYSGTIFAIVLGICFLISGFQTGCTRSKNLEADLVVIGGGGAGVAAALTAIQNGAKNIILLEKESALGGTSATAGGIIWAAETNIQNEAAVKTSRDEAFQEYMEFNHYDRVDPRVVRAFINETAETMKWLEENGIGYVTGMGYSLSPKDNTGAIRNFGRTIDKLASKFTAAGGKVLLNTSAEKISRGTDGKINSVTVRDQNGKTTQINTKSVILASGGFTGNEELLKKYFPEYWDSKAYHTEAVKTNAGDGITLAVDAGAALNSYATLVREPAYTFYEGENGFNRLCSQANAWVNKRGERFQNEKWEGNSSVNPLLRQPGKIGFALFDDKSVDSISGRLKSQGQDADLKAFYNSESKKGEWVKVSDNWDDIARWMGADPKVLKTTVDEYNSFCAKGHDAVFGKDTNSLNALLIPPFYAVKFGPLMIDTYGPVRINERMEVLDKGDNPIPGFYAGGAICGQMQGRDYHFFGGALSFAVNSGRIAAKNAVKYISEK